MIDFSGHHPLRALCAAWIAKIKLGMEYKKKEFQDDADEAMAFFNGPYDWIYKGRNGMMKAFVQGEEAIKPPAFGMTINKAAELVQIYGPALYHRNPYRQATPRRPPDIDLMQLSMLDPNLQMAAQMMGQQMATDEALDKARSAIMQAQLNYTPNALDLKTESRWAIDEGIIKGQGILLTEVYNPPSGGIKMIGSFWKSNDDLCVDPDVERQREAKWIAIRYTEPYWKVEEEFGWPQDSLKPAASGESYSQNAELSADDDGDYIRKRNDSNDVMTYWRVYSRMGLGGRLRGVDGKFREWDATFGYNVSLVVAENVPCPLNLPPEVLAVANNEEIKKRLEWPTPYWLDDSWPYTPVSFLDIPRKPWPMSLLKPAMGELYFLNWAYSFLANKVVTASRDFIVIAKGAAEELKNKIINAPNYTIIEIESLLGKISDVVQFLQHPDFNPEIYKVIEGVTANFEKRTGLTELVYGMSAAQLRSAEEASVKSDQISVRPDDMANKVEDWQSNIGRKEALASRWHLTSVDVKPSLGEVGAQWWDMLVASSDPLQLMRQIEFRVESGSTRKPNKAKLVADMTQAMQTLMQPLVEQYRMTGDPAQVNALLGDWAKANDFEVGNYLFPPLMPPAPAPAGEVPPEAA